MARRRKPVNETPEQTQTRQALETISNSATRSEKVSWERKMDNMVRILARLTPLEDQILDLMAEKQKILDDVERLRKEMVSECVHPYHMLTEKDKIIHCKFCNKRFTINDIKDKKHG